MKKKDFLEELKDCIGDADLDHNFFEAWYKELDKQLKPNFDYKWLNEKDLVSVGLMIVGTHTESGAHFFVCRKEKMDQEHWFTARKGE